MADARAEEAVRKAEAKLKKQREQEIKDAERDAAEMAHLMANDPEVRHVLVALYIKSTELEAPKTDEVVSSLDERIVRYVLIFLFL